MSPRLVDLLGVETLRACGALGRAADGVRGVTDAACEVGPGWIYVDGTASRARPGSVRDALDRGALAVVVPEPPRARTGRAVVIVDPSPRRRLASLAAAFHGRQPDVVVAVTGTNGKTSVVDFTAQLWSALGRRAATMGTLGVRPRGIPFPYGVTTPSAPVLHAHLSALARDGVGRVALEATSIGLAEHRVDGVDLAAAAFTNLTDEHLGYHGGRDAYFLAKRRLFDDVLAPGRAAVLNTDSDRFPALRQACRSRGHRVLTYGRADADLQLLSLERRGRDQIAGLAVSGVRHRVRVPLTASFQVENALCAAGLLIACGEDASATIGAMESLVGVPGRLEHVGTHPSGAPVYVDYAHTPDALASLLRALRGVTGRELAVVFGCGGTSDPAKRGRMGAVAARLADRVVVCDDNPRHEPPEAIRAAILRGCPSATEIGDRGDAIRAAVGALRAGDVLVVAGRGCEARQEVGDTTRRFDDRDAVRAALGHLGGSV